MKKIILMLLISIFICAVTTQTSQANQTGSEQGDSELYPWIGKYCMSFFTKARSAKTVGKDHVSVALKVQHFDWNLVRGSDDKYHGRPSGQSKRQLNMVLCTKYGWAENHHLAIGVPYLFNDFNLGTPNDSHGVSNVYIFEKWNIIKETNNIPGVAVDFWYYLPNGDTDRKIGSDDSSYKITTEISKAWKDFSLHFNPGYTWSEDKDIEVAEINGALLFTPYPDLWPAIEYNYYQKEHSGHRNDIIPGIIWKFKKGWSFKAGVPINIDSTFTDRDRVGVVVKLFRRW
jgi:hypothetical protein